MRALGCVLAALALTTAAPAPAEAPETAPGGSAPARVEFPAHVSFEHEGRPYELHVTGLAVRRFAIFKVYEMAHYTDAPAGLSGAALLEAVLSDRVAKQVTMQFTRDIGGERISKALVRSVERNADQETLRDAAPAMSMFADAVREDVRSGQRFTVRWLPGGITLCVLDGKQVLALRDRAFARALWSMWFGDHAVVDRDALLGTDVADSR